jgi:hypothetical protein
LFTLEPEQVDRGLLGVDSFEEKEGEIMETKGTTLRVSLTRSSSIVFNSRAAINIFKTIFIMTGSVDGHLKKIIRIAFYPGL